MNSLSTQERNTGVESSKCANVHAMQIASRTSFDGVTIVLHWTTVVLVLVLLTTALLHAQLHEDPTKALLLRIHQSVGVAVWMTTAFRLAWRITNAKLPPFPDDMTRLHGSFVQISEYCLYALLLIQPRMALIIGMQRSLGELSLHAHVQTSRSRSPGRARLQTTRFTVDFGHLPLRSEPSDGAKRTCIIVAS